MWTPVDVALVLSTASIIISVFNYLMIMRLLEQFDRFMVGFEEEKPVRKIGFSLPKRTEKD